MQLFACALLYATFCVCVFSLILFFDMFDGWSIVKLTGWSYVARGASVSGPRPLLGPTVRWPSEGGLWIYVGDLRPLRAVLGRSWNLCRRSWLHLGGSWGLYWRSGTDLGPLLAVLGRSWGRCVRSWAALGAYVGGLGPLLGLVAILGCSNASGNMGPKRVTPPKPAEAHESSGASTYLFYRYVYMYAYVYVCIVTL